MNTGGLVAALGTVLAAVMTVLVGYFVKRTDRVAKLTQSNMQDQEYIMRLVSSLRDDYWALADWAYSTRGLCSGAFKRLAALTGEAEQQVAPMPEPRHRLLETKHARGQSIDDED